MAGRNRRTGDPRPRTLHRCRSNHGRTGRGWCWRSGGLTGALVGMGIPEYEAKRYEGRVKDGGILLSVHSDNSDETKRAKEILESTGAQDISSTGEARGDKSIVPDRHVA